MYLQKRTFSEPEVLSASKEHMRVLKGTMWLLKSVRESALWPQACSHLYVALNEHALTSQVAAQSAERGGVWSLCIHNEWKERKTTQWHGQIRLSETIFKIWVRVQILTSPSHTPQRFTLPILQTIFLHLVLLPFDFSFLSYIFIFSHTYFIHSVPLFLVFRFKCWAWCVLLEASSETAALPVLSFTGSRVKLD